MSERNVSITPPADVVGQIKLAILRTKPCAGKISPDGKKIKCNDVQTDQSCRGIGGSNDRSCKLRDHQHASPSQTWVPIEMLEGYKIK